MAEKKYGMLIDLSLCIGCNACAIICREENDTPLTKFNTWVESWDVERPDSYIARANVPKQCNHCDNPACVSVCPTGASYKAEDGTVQIDESRCIGCKYCMAACPRRSLRHSRHGRDRQVHVLRASHGVRHAARLRVHLRHQGAHLR